MVECLTQDCGFEPHRRHCLVFLSKTIYPLLSTVSTQEDPSEHNGKVVDWDVNNQIKLNKSFKKLYYCVIGLVQALLYIAPVLKT